MIENGHCVICNERVYDWEVKGHICRPRFLAWEKDAMQFSEAEELASYSKNPVNQFARDAEQAAEHYYAAIDEGEHDSSMDVCVLPWKDVENLLDENDPDEAALKKAVCYEVYREMVPSYTAAKKVKD
jgi:hypothetical protein